MKNLIVFALLLVSSLCWVAGCSTKPSQPTFHVVSVDTCARPQLVGTVGKMRFGLNAVRDPKVVVACPGFWMDLKDIGKDYPVVIDLDHRLVTITVNAPNPATYEESLKGKMWGEGTHPVQEKFDIDRMQDRSRDGKFLDPRFRSGKSAGGHHVARGQCVYLDVLSQQFIFFNHGLDHLVC